MSKMGWGQNYGRDQSKLWVGAYTFMGGGSSQPKLWREGVRVLYIIEEEYIKCSKRVAGITCFAPPHIGVSISQFQIYSIKHLIMLPKLLLGNSWKPQELSPCNSAGCSFLSKPSSTYPATAKTTADILR